MTDRPTASTITDAQLDALHDQLDRARALADRWDNALAIDKPYARALRATLDGPGPEETCTEHDGPCFPDPTAQCPAHGEQQCAACHRNPSSCADRDYVECGFWSSTGMHWDTCSNRIRGPLTVSAPPCEGFPDRCPNPIDVPAQSPYHGGGVRCGCGNRPKEQ